MPKRKKAKRPKPAPASKPAPAPAKEPQSLDIDAIYAELQQMAMRRARVEAEAELAERELEEKQERYADSSEVKRAATQVLARFFAKVDGHANLADFSDALRATIAPDRGFKDEPAAAWLLAELVVEACL